MEWLGHVVGGMLSSCRVASFEAAHSRNPGQGHAWKGVTTAEAPDVRFSTVTRFVICSMVVYRGRAAEVLVGPCCVRKTVPAAG